ncbi:MAG: Lrp/AsnC family transcriptional regulator [Nanoarchaeota archaeon]|nr:Lrp/AsnC family transcriptional regulator [Nanoarchaeota archaeon]
MDARDITILKELDKNSRIPFQQIAKKINLSKDTVNYRIENLKKQGIIKGFHASINVGKLGYIGMRLLVKLYQVSPEKEQEIINYLLDEPSLGWVVSVEGYWDINTYFYFKDINQMHLFYQTFIDKYSNYIENKNFSIYHQIKAYSRDYLDKQLERTPFIIYENSVPIDIDEKDTIILSLLGGDARTTILKMSQETGLTSKTVIERIKKLEKENIITGYRLTLGLDKLNYIYYKIHITLFNSTIEKKHQLIQHIRENPNIIYEDQLIGGYDIEFEFEAQTPDQIRNFIDDMRRKFSTIIKEYELLTYYRLHQERFFPKIKVQNKKDNFIDKLSNK